MGTNVIKFTAPTGNDTMYIRGSQQSVMSKHMCISGMQEYKGQSLEELRIADYLAGRKVNTRAPTETTEFDQLQGAGLFGPPVNPSGGIFTGSTTSVPAFPVATAITSLFGTQSASASAEPSRSIFGQTSASGSIFGQTSASESIFGQTSARGGIFTGATTSVPAFPVATTAKNSLFGIGTKAAYAEPSGSIFNPTSSQSQEQTTGIFGKLQSPVMAPLSNSNIGNVSSSMAKQQDERPQFGLHQNPLNGTIGTAGNTHNFGNDLKEQELMISNLEESKNQALHAKVEKVELMPQGALENLEFKTENRALKENVEQKANDHALEAKMEEFPNMHTEQQNQMVAQIETLEAKLSTQNEEHQKQMEELESKNRMLEEKLRNVELADKRELNGKMEQPKDECSNSKMPPGLDVE